MTALKIAADNEPVSAELYDVTPAVAKRWLSRNVRNRPIREGVVDAYARDMKSGGWRITGEAIKFDTNGALSDGQHRLTAIIQSGVTVTMLIVRGVEPDAQGVMDSGAKRSAGDALTLEGKNYGLIVAAIARLALREAGAGFVVPEQAVRNPTNTEITRFVAENPDVVQAAEIAARYYPAFDCPPSVIGACWMRFSAISITDAVEFFDGVASMNTDGEGDARLALIRRLANARRSRERLEQAAYLSLVFRAWNAYRAGKAVSKLQVETRGKATGIPGRLR